MIEYEGYMYPDGDLHTARSILNEWIRKGQNIIDLVPRKRVCVQAGANAGLFPIRLAKSFEQVITFEPIPHIYECAVHNIANRGSKNIKLYQMGLGQEATTASVYFENEHNSGATSLTQNDEGEIELIALDNLFLEHCDLIWLDIEGFEVDALIGAANTIRAYNPIIVLENKGLIPGMGGDLNGSEELRDWMKAVFDYEYVGRMMRDDIFRKA